MTLNHVVKDGSQPAGRKHSSLSGIDFLELAPGPAPRPRRLSAGGSLKVVCRILISDEGSSSATNQPPAMPELPERHSAQECYRNHQHAFRSRIL